MAPLLKAYQVSKQFGTLAAISNVSLEIQCGEVVGLAGQTGAGKSILIRILSGLQTPDSGRLAFNGQRLNWPFEAQKAGIGVVYQEPILADQLDVPSNIFLGHETRTRIFNRWFNIPNQSRMDEEARRLLDLLGADITNLHIKSGNLSSEQRQLVALAQVMARPLRLIIVDDPSQSLSLPYQEKLLDLIREWQLKETGVLFSSYNLDHLFAVADRIIVLRQGSLVANWRTDETTREEVVAALVGTASRQQRTPVIWALDSYFRARKQAETLQHNQTLLRKDLAAQGTINQQLLQQLADQVRALDSANLALQDAQRRLLTEREQERKHLARELHDQVIQDLLSLNYELEEIESRAEEPGLADEVVTIRGHVRTLVEDIRRICGDLRPPTIDSLGLGSALQSYLRQWSQRTGIAFKLSLSKNFGRLPETIELSIFRIVQEGLSNVWKHANATAVSVSLQHTSPRMLLVSILDDGTGLEEAFDLSALSSAGHYGLLGISERVALMGGRLRYQNQPEGGLLLQVEIPHPRVMQSDLSNPL